MATETLTASDGLDGFVIKLSGIDGSVLWHQTLFGMGDQRVDALAVDRDGNVLVAGMCEGTIDVGGAGVSCAAGAGNGHFWMAGLSADGAARFARGIGEGGFTNFPAVALDDDGNAYIAGGFVGSATFDTTVIATSVDAEDVFVASYDQLGDYRWHRVLRGPGSDLPRAMAHDGEGGVVVVGRFEDDMDVLGQILTAFAGDADPFVAHLSGDGERVAAKSFEAGGFVDPTAVAVREGNVYLAGIVNGYMVLDGVPVSSNDNDVFIAAFDRSLARLWSAGYGGMGTDVTTALAVDDTMRVWLSGIFSTSIDFGLGMHNSAGDFDIFALELSAAGEPMWERQFWRHVVSVHRCDRGAWLRSDDGNGRRRHRLARHAHRCARRTMHRRQGAGSVRCVHGDASCCADGADVGMRRRIAEQPSAGVVNRGQNAIGSRRSAGAAAQGGQRPALPRAGPRLRHAASRCLLRQRHRSELRACRDGAALRRFRRLGQAPRRDARDGLRQGCEPRLRRAR